MNAARTIRGMIVTSAFPRWIWSGFLAATFAAQVSIAQVIVSPVAVVETDLGVFDPSVPLTNMINQSGIDIPFVSGSTDFATYFAPGNTAFAQNGAGNNWQSDFSFELPLTGFVEFDLGASYEITGMAIWNVSVRDVTVKLLEDLNGPEQVAGAFTLTNHVNFPFSYPPDVLRFDASHHGRYLRLEIESAYTFSPSDTFAYAIIGEVVVAATDTGTPPNLSISRSNNGDVTVTFTGTLESAATVEGPYSPVPGDPQGTHAISSDELEERQFFRARLE
jgi:hypothetical protein